MTRLVVVGAGITGLAAAYEWRRAVRTTRSSCWRPATGSAASCTGSSSPGTGTTPARRRCSRGSPRRCGWSSGSGSATGSSRRRRPRPRSSCPTGGTRCRPGPCWACRRRPTGSRVSSPRTASPGCAPRPSLPPVHLDGDVAVGRAAARAARRRGGRPAGRAAARRGLRRPGRRAVAGRDHAGAGRAAAAPRARCSPPRPPPGTPGARSRGDADGPVFVTVRDGIGVAARRAGGRRRGADVRLRTPAHGAAADGVAASSCRSVRPPRPETLTADAVIVTAPAPKAARLLADARCPARSSRCRASRTRRWPWWRWRSRRRRSPPARGCWCRRSRAGWSRA